MSTPASRTSGRKSSSGPAGGRAGVTRYSRDFARRFRSGCMLFSGIRPLVDQSNRIQTYRRGPRAAAYLYDFCKQGGELMFDGKQVVVLGERDGVSGGAIVACVEAAGVEK